MFGDLTDEKKKKKFENITRIDTPELFEAVYDYVGELIMEAATNGSLDEQGTKNEYTLEISRAGGMCHSSRVAN